jgi:hypothetical protein
VGPSRSCHLRGCAPSSGRTERPATSPEEARPIEAEARSEGVSRAVILRRGLGLLMDGITIPAGTVGGPEGEHMITSIKHYTARTKRAVNSGGVR